MPEKLAGIVDASLLSELGVWSSRLAGGSVACVSSNCWTWFILFTLSAMKLQEMHDTARQHDSVCSASLFSDRDGGRATKHVVP